MNKKLLVGIIIALAVALIFETVYLFSSRQQQKKKHMIADVSYPAFPKYSFFDDDFSVFNDMRNWDPFQEMERIQQKMHRIFEDSFSKGLTDRTIFRENLAFEPNISINQKDKAYVVKADLPGMEKSSISIEVRGRELILSGERKQEESRKDNRFYRQELSYGAFSRSIMLPEDAKTDQISSEYKNGVLTVTIPKETVSKPETPAIKIPVQ